MKESFSPCLRVTAHRNRHQALHAALSLFHKHSCRSYMMLQGTAVYLLLQDLTLVMALLVALHLRQQPVLILQLPLQQSSILQGIIRSISRFYHAPETGN